MLSGANTAAPLLNDYIDSKLAELSLDASALALVGFSQGTMMALYASLRRANSVAGIVGFSGALVGDETITGQALKSKPSICLIHGDADDVVPYGALAQANDILSALGVPVEAHTRPNLGHGIDPDGLEIAEKFLSRVLV
jgi:phospholipase/carboxylesterase